MCSTVIFGAAWTVETMTADSQMSQISQTTEGIFGDCFNLVPFDESVQSQIRIISVGKQNVSTVYNDILHTSNAYSVDAHTHTYIYTVSLVDGAGGGRSLCLILTWINVTDDCFRNDSQLCVQHGVIQSIKIFKLCNHI